MTRTSNIEITQNGDSSHLRVSGPVNEVTGPGLLDLLENLQSKCVINLRDFEYINSVGVRCWLAFMAKLCQSKTVVLEECAFEFILQVNMVPALVGTAQISSVCALYLCENCNREENLLINVEELKTKIPSDMQHKSCFSCDDRATLEEDAELFMRYFIRDVQG